MSQPEQSNPQEQGSASASQPEEPVQQESKPVTLLYMGQGSLRIVTVEEKVIYIDPFSGNSYDLPADLILVTHGHPAHN